MSSNDKYTELGVTFKVLEPSDQPIIMEFLMESFFPDEPIMRSLKLLEGSGMVSNYISGLVRDELVDPCLLDGQSIAAIDKDGTVIGTRYIFTFLFYLSSSRKGTFLNDVRFLGRYFGRSMQNMAIFLI